MTGKKDLSLEEVLRFFEKKSKIPTEQLKTPWGKRTTFYYYYKGYRLQITPEELLRNTSREDRVSLITTRLDSAIEQSRKIS